MAENNAPNRCRLVLILPREATPETGASLVADAIDGGDVASLIIPVDERDEATLQRLGEVVVPICHARGVAVMIENDTRIAGRIKADGVHLETGAADIGEQIEHLEGRLLVGAGGIKTRDEALDLGEVEPDYVFFGRFGYDNKPEAHSRNLKLAEWWAEMLSLPCIVLGGSDPASAVAVANTGADLVAMTSAVFGGDNGDPRAAVAAINALLDEQAPRFEG
jgi:thiamine-phosphate pyrophosphorylase